jgi:hypothetical protein
MSSRGAGRLLTAPTVDRQSFLNSVAERQVTALGSRDPLPGPIRQAAAVVAAHV